MAEGKQFSGLPDDSSGFVARLAASQRELGAFIYAMVPHWADAEEILQETSARLWEQRGEYDSARPFLPWARTVAHYQVLSYRTRQRRSKIRFSQTVVDALAQETSAMDHEWDRRVEFLHQCLEKLSEASRQLLRLSYFGDLSVREVSGRLRKSEAATYKALARSRWVLHACIQQQLQKAGER